MEPSTKRRKLAPKVPTPTDPIPPPVQHVHEPPHYPVPEPPIAERHDFETFARHLQDAAMLIQRQTELPQYTDVSVLMLRWEGDESPDDDLLALEKLFDSAYHFHTQRWQIPNCPNPSIKLGVQIASFLENPRPDHLLIIYYSGHGFVGADKHLYWASNARDDSAKLKWDGVRCLFEDAQSDMLLLLDTCAIPDPPASGNNGVKQAISACSPDHAVRGPGRSFTSQLVEVFHKLSGARSFSTQRLYDEVLALQHHQIRQAPPPPTTNGAPPNVKLPVFFTITPGKSQHLTLAPAARPPPLTPSHNGAEHEVKKNPAIEEQLIEPEAVAEIKFEEARILVCTTYVGDASADMSYFHNWLQNTPPMGAKVAVEGMFLGPPTMLLISMPHSLWSVIQHDKVCCYLGNITSHNMLHLYQRLVGPSGPKQSAKGAENGRILLEARKLAAAPVPPTPVSSGGESREFPPPQREHPRVDLPKIPPPTPPSGRGPYISPGSAPLKRKEEHEGSAEMREAAEQLKALSHVRHRSDEGGQTGRPRTSLPNGITPTDGQREDPDGSPKAKSPTNRVKVPRHALPKNETVCSHCSHAPFRDSSSLRKHIAAAHTRPFPCAFSFAGCNSTFGSKNEWKRHITSQHLCLQYYRCSACPQSAIEGKGNEFNRKDLFTQHLRRMHAPFQIKRPASKNDSKMQSEWEVQVKQLQESCLVTRRQPPQRAACPKADCQHTFEGHSAWDEWTEHVGRHMEKGEASNLPVDRNLIDWALREGIIEMKQDGEYRLCYNSAGGSNGHSATGDGSSFMEMKDPVSRAPDPSRPAPTGTPAPLSPATVPSESPKKEAPVPDEARDPREKSKLEEGKPLPTEAKWESDAMDIDK